MASLSQSRDQLENWGGKDDEVLRRMWKAIETGIEKIRVTKTKRRRRKGRGRKEVRKEEAREGSKKQEKAERNKNGRGEMASREMGNMGWEREDSKIRRSE